MSTPDCRPNDPPGPSSDAVDAVAFLARSEHRVRVLALLAEGARTRRELRERTPVTRVTLSRILGDLEERGWIEHDRAEDAYALTAFGEHVYADFARLLDTVGAGQSLTGVLGRLPTDWFGFDLRCLADAELVGTEGPDQLSGARELADAVHDASSCHVLVGTFVSLMLYRTGEAVRDGFEPKGTVVFDDAVAETVLADPDLRERWRAVETAAPVAYFHAVQESFPCTVSLVDNERVFLVVGRGEDGGFDIVRCSHPDVVEWARTTVDEYRERAAPLGQHPAADSVGE